MEPMPRVLVVDDHPVVRQGLAALLSSAPDDVQVVASVGTAREALDEVERLRPDVVVADLRLGEGEPDGIWLTEQVRARPDGPAVLILTTYDHDRDIVRAGEAGAAGYLLKDADPERIIAAVVDAAAGQDVLTDDLAQRAVDTMREARPDLSARELDVLRLVARGASNREIARELFVTEATVKTHLARAYPKLGVDSRTAAVARAHDLGLFD